MENFNEILDMSKPLARNISISNVDEFLSRDDKQSISENLSNIINISQPSLEDLICNQLLYRNDFVHSHDNEIEQSCDNNDNINQKKSVYINIENIEKVPNNVLPRISITGLTPFGKDEDLFAALDKSSIELFVARNQNQRGWSDIPLAITNFESPLNAEETDKMFISFLKERNIICNVVVSGMFYKCYHSEGFSSVAIHVKLYFHTGKNPIMEFRRVQGSPEIFFNIYGTFRNLILNENNPVSLTPPPCDLTFEKVLMSKEEQDAANSSLIQWLNSSPADAIKVVSQVAMEKDKKTQIIMCNEVYNILHKQKDLSALMAQTLGFIDVIQGINCLLDEEHKISILSKLKIKLEASIDAPNIQMSVIQRALCFITKEIHSA